MTKPLDGIRIIDFTHVQAPFEIRFYARDQVDLWNRSLRDLD